MVLFDKDIFFFKLFKWRFFGNGQISLFSYSVRVSCLGNKVCDHALLFQVLNFYQSSD